LHTHTKQETKKQKQKHDKKKLKAKKNRDFILITSIEIVESKFLELGYLRSKSTTGDQPQNGPVREQHLTVRIMMRIEMHQ